MFMWPHIKAWHVANLPTITGIDPAFVFDGPPVSGDNPTSYIAVGWGGTGEASGDFQQTYADDGMGMLEDGTLLCLVVAQTGDEALPEDAAFAIAAAWDAALKADRSLGGLMAPNNSIWLQVQPQGVQNRKGAAVPLIVSVQYHCEVWS